MTPWDLFATTLVSVMLAFGNGAVMLPLLERAFVADTHLLTMNQMLYAYALGRVTPGQGNLYVTAVGYMAFGLPGAIICVFAMILPGYLIIPMWHAYAALRRIRAIDRFTRGVIGTAVGLIFATIWSLGRQTLTTPIPVLVFVLAIVLVRFTRLPTVASLGVAVAGGAAAYMATGALV